MAPAVMKLDDDPEHHGHGLLDGDSRDSQCYVLNRDLKQEPLPIRLASGIYIELKEGRTILDASVGASVACLGYGRNARIDTAIKTQRSEVSYFASGTWMASAYKNLAEYMVASTGHQMAKYAAYTGGSESNDAAIKLCRQYWWEKEGPNTSRVNVISREGSYHGNTGFALAASGYKARREIYEHMFSPIWHRIPAVNPQFDRIAGETDETYNERKANELDAKIRKLGAHTVSCYIMEPVVGAAIGSVEPPFGYLRAIQRVCQKHEVLLIFDEVMCGMGRTGRLHAWQREGVVPDIQTVGKGLGAGYEPAAGMLVGPRIANVLFTGTGCFVNGYTYQGHAISCVAALETQRIIKEDNLLANVCKMGRILKAALKKGLESHPHVSHVDGPGLFIAVHLVQDKAIKECFAREHQVAESIQSLGLQAPHNIYVYANGGNAVDGKGDHFIVSPPYNVTREEVNLIVTRVCNLIQAYQFPSALERPRSHSHLSVERELHGKDLHHAIIAQSAPSRTSHDHYWNLSTKGT